MADSAPRLLVLAAQAAPGVPVAMLEQVMVPVCRLWAGRVQARPVRPVVVSTSGLPGTGKTTLLRVCSALLEQLGVRACGFSLDDVYRTHEERRQLAAQVHPLLAARGVPGTHDVELAIATLDRLRDPAPQQETPLPRFDKLLDDRAPSAAWPVVRGRPDLVVLDAWFWGAAPPPDASLDPPLNLREAREDADGRFRAHVAHALAGRYQDLFRRSELNIHLAAPSHEASVRWRIEQGRSELAARGLDPAQLDPERIRRFLDLFQRVGTWPRGAGSELRVVLDDGHLPSRVVPSPDLVEEWARACGS
jgi:D-glycerate 3-kinase